MKTRGQSFCISSAPAPTFADRKQKKGKIDIFSEIDGLLKVDTERLKAVNLLGDVIISTRHGNFPVKKGDKLAGMRVIPLVVEEERLNRARAAAGMLPF